MSEDNKDNLIRMMQQIDEHRRNAIRHLSATSIENYKEIMVQNWPEISKILKEILTPKD